MENIISKMEYINSILLLFIFVYNNFRKNKDVRMIDVRMMCKWLMYKIHVKMITRIDFNKKVAKINE